MEFRAGVVCNKCQQPIFPEEGRAFVYFKIPSEDGYHFFHCRLQGRDCWEAYLRERE
jgi:hypothetical protein